MAIMSAAKTRLIPVLLLQNGLLVRSDLQEIVGAPATVETRRCRKSSSTERRLHPRADRRRSSRRQASARLAEGGKHQGPGPGLRHQARQATASRPEPRRRRRRRSERRTPRAVRAGGKGFINHNLFAGVIPVTVIIEVDPGVERSCLGCHDIHRRRSTQPQRTGKHHAVFVVRCSVGIVTVGVIQNLEALANKAFGERRTHFSEMSGGEINPTEVVATLINEGSFIAT